MFRGRLEWIDVGDCPSQRPWVESSVGGEFKGQKDEDAAMHDASCPMVMWYFSFLLPITSIPYTLAESPCYHLETVLYLYGLNWWTLCGVAVKWIYRAETDCFEVRPEETRITTTK